MNDWIKIAVIPMLCLSLLIAVTALYVRPGQLKNKNLQTELDVLQGKGDRMVPVEKILAQESMVDSLNIVVKDMKDRLYPVAEFADLGQAIENSGRRFNLRLVTLTPDYSQLNLIQQEGVEITELPITINMQGQFLQFAHYLEKLSEFPYVRAMEVNLTRSEDVVVANDILIEMKGVVIFKSKTVSAPVKDKQTIPAKT